MRPTPVEKRAVLRRNRQQRDAQPRGPLRSRYPWRSHFQVDLQSDSRMLQYAAVCVLYIASHCVWSTEGFDLKTTIGLGERRVGYDRVRL